MAVSKTEQEMDSWTRLQVLTELIDEATFTERLRKRLFRIGQPVRGGGVAKSLIRSTRITFNSETKEFDLVDGMNDTNTWTTFVVGKVQKAFVHVSNDWWMGKFTPNKELRDAAGIRDKLIYFNGDTAEFHLSTASNEDRVADFKRTLITSLLKDHPRLDEELENQENLIEGRHVLSTKSSIEQVGGFQEMARELSGGNPLVRQEIMKILYDFHEFELAKRASERARKKHR